jgi:hypothetical protein
MGNDSFGFLLLPVVGALVFLGGLYALVLGRMRRRQRAWSTFATQRGWEFSAKGGGLRLSNVMEAQGPHQGHQVSLLTERRGSGGSRHDVTVLRVDLGTAVPRRLSLTSEDGLFHLLEGKQGPALDAALELASQRGLVTPEVRQLLQAPRVQQHLLGLGQAYPRYTLEERMLEAEHRGLPDTVEALEAAVAPALDLVDALDAVARGAGAQRA